MLNNDNQITVGHKQKKEFKAMLDNYIRARKSGAAGHVKQTSHIPVWGYGFLLY